LPRLPPFAQWISHSTSKFTGYCSTPLLLLLQPFGSATLSELSTQTLPFKAYESTVEIRDRMSRSVFVEVPFRVETGEAERIAVDWTARGGGSGTSCKYSHWLTFVLLMIFFPSGITLAGSTSGCKNAA
jgi:hypothetical protein